MANIDFSKEMRAILENRALSSYIVKRMSNRTPEEFAAGKIEINLRNGDKPTLA